MIVRELSTDASQYHKCRIAVGGRPNAVSNGSRLLDGIDGRSAGARRFKDLIESFSRDLGWVEHLSETEQSLIRQAASVTMRAEQLQAAIVRGEHVDSDELVRLSNSARRCLAGIQSQVEAA